VHPAQIEAQLPALVRKHAGPATGAHEHRHPLQALADLHFDTKLGIFNNSRAAAHRPTLRILTGVCLLLLLVAVVNLVNLVTAQGVRRAREVGVRKILGSTRGELVRQFLSETLLVTSAAVLLSVLLAALALHYFGEFIPEGVTFDLTTRPRCCFCSRPRWW
jgi:ABC-type antimicrobial peptide transport system permease subunit